MECSCPQSGQGCRASIQRQDSPGVAQQVRVEADFWVLRSGHLGGLQDTPLCRASVRKPQEQRQSCPQGPFLPHPPLVWSVRSPKQFPHFTCEVDHTPHPPKHHKQNNKAQTLQQPLFVLGIEMTPCVGLQGPSSFCHLCGQPELPACPSSLPSSPASYVVGRLHTVPTGCHAVSRPLPLQRSACTPAQWCRTPTRATHRPAPSARPWQPRVRTGTGRCVCPVPGSPRDSELHGAGPRPALCSSCSPHIVGAL